MIITKKTYLLVIALISLSTICKPKRRKIMAAYKIACSRLSDRRGSARVKGRRKYERMVWETGSCLDFADATISELGKGYVQYIPD